MVYLITHLAILQVLLPFIGALCCALSFKRQRAYSIALLSIWLSLGVSILLLIDHQDYTSYVLGGWPKEVGIEYKSYHFNQILVVFINFILLIFLIANNSVIKQQIFQNLNEQQQPLIYAIFLLAHAGALGILSTNDLFNLYVFIEIASLSACALISQGQDKKALLSAISYLIISSIGATFILISIGLLLSITGHLNISAISEAISASDDKVIILAISFFIVGCLLKVGLFPLNLALLRIYQYSSPVILSYLAVHSSIIGWAIFERFLYQVLNPSLLSVIFWDTLSIFACFAIISGSVLATIAKTIRMLIIYSSMSQVGYFLLCCTLATPSNLLLSYIINDSITKFCLFTTLSLLVVKDHGQLLEVKDLQGLWRSSHWIALLLCTNLLNIASLPPTLGFINKLQLLMSLASAKAWLIFAIVIASSLFALIYTYRIAEAMFQPSTLKIRIAQTNPVIGLTVATFATVLQLYLQVLT